MVASLFTLALILALESFYKEALYGYSLDLIPLIQQGASPTKQTMWKLFSDWSLIALSGGPVSYYIFNEPDRAMATYYSVVLSAITFVMNFLKLRYHDPRPFWSSDAVQAF